MEQIRKRVYPSGAVQYVMQCLCCGRCGGIVEKEVALKMNPNPLPVNEQAHQLTYARRRT